MDVKFIKSTSDKVSDIPIVNGQFIALEDTLGYFYDLDGKRFSVVTINSVGVLPETGSEGSLYTLIENDKAFVYTFHNGRWYPVSATDGTSDPFFLINDSVASSLRTFSSQHQLDTFYTREQVNQIVTSAIASVVQFKYQVVDTLPTSGEAGTIYFVHHQHTDPDDRCDEYVFVEGLWEKIGNTDIDFSDYPTRSEVDEDIAESTATCKAASEAVQKNLNELNKSLAKVAKSGSASDVSTTAISGVSGTNVQSMLSSLQTNINGKISTSASCNKNWYWQGQAGQPSWLWGSNDGSNIYVYNPSNFSVNWANGAEYGNKLQTIDGNHFMIAERFDAWNTRLYMCYGGKAERMNTIHVAYADGAGYANSAGSATWASNADIFQAGELYSSRSHWGDSTGSPNMRISPQDNRIMGTTGSSKRWKNSITEEITDEGLDPHRLYSTQVFQYKYNTDYTNDEDVRHDIPLIGFIAEELYDSYRVACDYTLDAEGNPDCTGWNPMYIVPPMLKLVQEQHEEIESMKSVISELIERLDRLENN